ncbi:MAG: DUF3127 domain-containing protein [Porphyromonadaceae bacterium]|nr:DUF3127 domain-containing protein [Porphyromonadaceae bacterium]
MDISGKVIAVLPEQSGQGKNGLWRSQDFVIETSEQYPKKICINLFNDRIDKFPIAVGENVTVSFDIESREYNSRWYTTIRAWNVRKEEAASQQNEVPLPDISHAPPIIDQNNQSFSVGTDDVKDLPF